MVRYVTGEFIFNMKYKTGYVKYNKYPISLYILELKNNCFDFIF